MQPLRRPTRAVQTSRSSCSRNRNRSSLCKCTKFSRASTTLSTPAEMRVDCVAHEHLVPYLNLQVCYKLRVYYDYMVQLLYRHEPTLKYPPSPCLEPLSPFQMCRRLLHQLGFLSGEVRPQFHLLKKNAALLRELSALDQQHWYAVCAQPTNACPIDEEQNTSSNSSL